MLASFNSFLVSVAALSLSFGNRSLRFFVSAYGVFPLIDLVKFYSVLGDPLSDSRGF